MVILRYRYLILLSIIILALGVTLALVTSTRSDQVSIKDITTKKDDTVVRISLGRYESSFSASEKADMTRTLDKYINQLQIKGEVEAVAQIESLVIKPMDGGIPLRMVILDVAKNKSSYIVKIYGDNREYADYYSIIIDCAPANQQAYTSATCQDIHD